MNCPHERDVLAGRNPEHAATCEECAAALAVAPWMSQFAKLDVRTRALPDPTIVYLKAQILGGANQVARAGRPMAVLQMMAYIAVVGAWAAVLWWKWDAIATPLLFVNAMSRASLTFFGMVLVLTSMTVTLALHTIMAED